MYNSKNCYIRFVDRSTYKINRSVTPQSKKMFISVSPLQFFDPNGVSYHLSLKKVTYHFRISSHKRCYFLHPTFLKSYIYFWKCIFGWYILPGNAFSLHIVLNLHFWLYQKKKITFLNVYLWNYLGSVPMEKFAMTNNSIAFSSKKNKIV